MSKKLKVLDLFSGIGGFSLGLERAKYEGGQYDGFETVAFCEIEEYPRRVLAKHWPDVPCYRDVRELTGEQLASDGIAVDVITGGFPCQDLSTAGTGDGLDGERSGLWWKYFRLIREIRPKFVIVENSPELLNGWAGDVFGPLAEIGYDAEWECIPASAVGAPHRRDRVWIIAYPNGVGQSQPRRFDYTLHSTEVPFREADAFVASLRRDAMPYLCGRHDGVPPRVAGPRLTALGNAVVPQIPEMIGNAILATVNT